MYFKISFHYTHFIDTLYRRNIEYKSSLYVIVYVLVLLFYTACVPVVLCALVTHRHTLARALVAHIGQAAAATPTQDARVGVVHEAVRLATEKSMLSHKIIIDIVLGQSY